MKKLALFLFSYSLLTAKGLTLQEVAPDYNVWLTGPIVAPSGHAVPAPHVNYEPYFYWIQNPEKYDKHWNAHKTSNPRQLQIQPTFQIGMNSFMEFDINPSFSYNNNQSKHSWVLNDCPWGLGIQLLHDKPGVTWYPAIKLKVGSNIPLGKYQRLDADKKGTDDGGSGTWAPNMGLVFSRLFWIKGKNYLATRYFIQYAVPTPVHVKGINNYGGARGTRGRVFPGNVFFTDLGMEYTCNQNWALAMDIAYQHNNKQRFSGRKGGVSMTAPSSEQISLAPALEYNWNANVGVIGGCWFAVAGRNSTRFVQWIVALNAYV